MFGLFGNPAGNIIKQYDQLPDMFRQGLSWEEMSARTGMPLRNIKQYSEAKYPGYGVRQETLKREEKPVAHATNTASELPGNFPGGGSGDNSDARERAATIGSYEAEIADINDQMGNVSKLAAGKRAEYEKGYKDAHQGIIDNFNTAEANYGKQEDRTKKSYQDSLGQIDSGASRNYRALMSLAGMYNAGRSSVALKDIPALVSEEASRSRAQVADKYGENMEDITAARAALNASKKKSIEKLEKDKQAGLSEIDTWEKGQNEALLRAKGQAEGNLAMARGGSWSQARQAMAGLQAQANRLRSDIAGSKATLYKGYQPAKLEVKEVAPKNYAVDTRGVEKTADGQGADSSTEVQYQEAIKKKRKNEQQLF